MKSYFFLSFFIFFITNSICQTGTQDIYPKVQFSEPVKVKLLAPIVSDVKDGLVAVQIPLTLKTFLYGTDLIQKAEINFKESSLYTQIRQEKAKNIVLDTVCFYGDNLLLICSYYSENPNFTGHHYASISYNTQTFRFEDTSIRKLDFIPYQHSKGGVHFDENKEQFCIIQYERYEESSNRAKVMIKVYDEGINNSRIFNGEINLMDGMITVKDVMFLNGDRVYLSTEEWSESEKNMDMKIHRIGADESLNFSFSPPRSLQMRSFKLSEIGDNVYCLGYNYNHVGELGFNKVNVDSCVFQKPVQATSIISNDIIKTRTVVPDNEYWKEIMDIHDPYIIKVFELNDSEYIVISEERRKLGYQPYLYGNICVSKFNSQGEVDWLSIIFKQQSSPYETMRLGRCSFIYFINSEKIYFIFGEKRSAYTKEFMPKDIIDINKGMRFQKVSDDNFPLTSLVTLDLNDGTINKRMLLQNGRNELNGPYSATMMLSEEENALFFSSSYANTNKYRIGKIQF